VTSDKIAAAQERGFGGREKLFEPSLLAPALACRGLATMKIITALIARSCFAAHRSESAHHYHALCGSRSATQYCSRRAGGSDCAARAAATHCLQLRTHPMQRTRDQVVYYNATLHAMPTKQQRRGERPRRCRRLQLPRGERPRRCRRLQLPRGERPRRCSRLQQRRGEGA
jgi:hypothetical protein